MVKSKLYALKRGIDQMLDVTSAEHESLRAGVYAGSGAATAGFIIADILGCLGLCSTVGNAAVEMKIASVTSKIDEWNRSVDYAVKGIDQFLHKDSKLCATPLKALNENYRG